MLPEDCDKLLAEAKLEVLERKQMLKSQLQRRKQIKENYKRKYEELFELRPEFLDSKFLFLKEACCRDASDALEAFSEFQICHQDLDLYQFPVFKEEFCDLLLDELNHFNASGMPKSRPNTMNQYGVILDELGMSDFFSKLRKDYLEKISSVLFPEWIGKSGLDSHRAFTVFYELSADKDLSWHYDNAEITLNVCLNDDYEGSQLVFTENKMQEGTKFKIFNY